MRSRFLAALVAAGACGWGAALLAQQPGAAAVKAAPTAAAPARVDFARHIKPILEARCLECHSQTRRKGGLSLATYEDLLDGGKDGAIVRPGRAAASMLRKRLIGEVDEPMPKDDEPLTPAQIALITRWIDEGARATPTSARAPMPWEAPLALTRPTVPAVTWTGWDRPDDRLVAAYLSRRGARRAPQAIADARFARRVYLDAWGLLPSPEELDAFVADRDPGKRARLVRTLLADRDRYADHWISFWNDLLRNEDGVTYFSEQNGRKSITDWLHRALRDNLPYDRFVVTLLNPAAPGDPEGFLTGVNWRGETSAAVTPWMQASQNTAQVFLGVNLKCTACHDSFVNKWKLKDAYGLAAYFAPEPKLQMFRCDVAQERYAEPGFLYPEVARSPRSLSLADRRAAAAATFTDPRLGRMPRTIVNRVWQRLLGHGIVGNPDEMDGEPWSPALLDWLAADFAANGYDLTRLIETILTSRAYQMPAVARRDAPNPRGYVFAGPELRRLSAEQFADAIGSITGEWSIGLAGVHAREWRAASSSLTRALGRPIRDQVTTTRSADATTLQALELTNGAVLTRRLSRGARRLTGELPADPVSLATRAVAGRNATTGRVDADISRSTRLWLIVEETGSNVPEAMLPAWADVELVGPAGATPLSALTPVDRAALRDGTGPVLVPETSGAGVRVRNPSVLVYDVAGRGFTRLRGAVGLENPKRDIGSTLNPALRFHVFDVPPDMDQLEPPKPGAPMPRPATLTTVDAAIDRVFRHALGRGPMPAERGIAEAALRDAERAGRPSPQGLADLLWVLVMKPEFQLID